MFKNMIFSEVIESDSLPQDSGEASQDTAPKEIFILPIRNTVLFPQVIMPITVGREKSANLVQYANKNNECIGIVTQKDAQAEDPHIAQLQKVGVVARILKKITLPDGNQTIIVQGLHRFAIEEELAFEPFLKVRYTKLDDLVINLNNNKDRALLSAIKDSVKKMIELSPDIPSEAQEAIENIGRPEFLVNFVCTHINLDPKEKQQLLDLNTFAERGKKLLKFLSRELQLLELKHDISTKTHNDLEQQQRDYFIRQQIKTLQEELSDGGGQDSERLAKRGAEKNWGNPKAEAAFQKELEKFARQNPQSPEYGISLNYLELMLDLPWATYSDAAFDLKKAQEILDQDHYGLQKVKERILEFLAVLKLKGSHSGSILCLHGPPGVGKTSLGKSIAKALGREYVRLSLGGMKDESEIRGHRRTYIGAMPGRIIQNIKKAGTSNPVFVLDEIDKVGSDFRGDPASALLEVLDPEQNHAFNDHYLEVDYDLSKVFFIATANDLSTLHPALRDRMEIIDLSGYTTEEKLEIGKRHLFPKQRTENGLKAKDLKITDEALLTLIEGYTREAGVRNLEQKIAALCRKVAKSVALEEKYAKTLTPAQVEKLLGAPLFERETHQPYPTAGIAMGLAWTQVGGEVLYIESLLSKGRGKLTLSGRLGEVMKESALTALSFLKSQAEKLGIEPRIFEQYDLHIHIPAGAVPKDGPSAGITLLTAMASAYTRRKVKSTIAMTGEITLQGKVLPVGGIKEKILAAKRLGVYDLILCQKNKKEVDEIEDFYKENLNFHFVENAHQVLELALSDQIADDLKLEVREMPSRERKRHKPKKTS
jgi:ATP-dependent Lon protease